MLRVTLLRTQRRLIWSEARAPQRVPTVALASRRRGQRTYADLSKPGSNTKDSILSSDPAHLPGTQSSHAPAKPEVPLGPVSATKASPTPATLTSAPIIPPENVPKVPPPPPPEVPKTAPRAQATVPPLPPPPSQPPTAPKPKRSLLRALLYVILVSGLAYGGGVIYALRSDNFHDFFTEYVPFGEEAVLFFEERSFRQRFPDAKHSSFRNTSPPKPDTNKVTIPQKAGLSWKVADHSEDKGSDLTQKGKHMSALDAKVPSNEEVKKAQQVPQQASREGKSAAVSGAKSDAPASSSSSADKKPDAKPAEKTSPKAESKTDTAAQPSVATPSPKSDPRPPAISPVAHISPLEIANAEEPLVRELVKIVNDLVTVVNSDSPEAANKYSAPIGKAKESLVNVGAKIMALKEAEKKAAEERLAQAHKEFDEGAKELLKRVDAARQEDDAKYREEFEAEQERISRLYENRLQAESERAKELADQRLKNELTEQAIELKRKFVSDIKSLVEEERDGRLSKLSDLSNNVDGLQQLTSNWNGVIDSNLATQKLQVAVDAVRTSLIRAAAIDDRPKPFVKEMAALKLVASGDPIVDAAIASINPTAYQRGIPSPAQLIDRFRRVASEVRKASLLPDDAGVASHAASFILSKVMFKKQGQPQGEDVESVLTRTETMLEEGDLDGAAREMNTLQGWASVLSKDWLQDCRKVLEVRQALDVIETEARLQCLRLE